MVLQLGRYRRKYYSKALTMKDSTVLACDSLLTALILFGLARAKTGWSNTDRVVSRLIRYV